MCTFWSTSYLLSCKAHVVLLHLAVVHCCSAIHVRHALHGICHTLLYCCEGCPPVRAYRQWRLLHLAGLAYLKRPPDISNCVGWHGRCWVLLQTPKTAHLSASAQVDHLLPNTAQQAPVSVGVHALFPNPARPATCRKYMCSMSPHHMPLTQVASDA